MSEKMKNLFDLRLACTIAAGILGALAAYELLAAALRWGASGWTDLTNQQQFGLTATMLGSGCYLLYRVIRRILRVRKLRAAGLPVPVWPAPRS